MKITYLGLPVVEVGLPQQDLGTTLLPTVGSIVQDSATTGHPRALNQRLLPVFLSLNTLPRE